MSEEIENKPEVETKNTTLFNIKLAVRYIMITVLFYIGWSIVDPKWVNSYEHKEVAMAIIAASWGALTFVIKSTFEQKIDK